MRQTKRFLVEESGSSLVYTLLVLTVLSILGISIGMVTLGSYQLGLNNRESTSTFYIAESGANLAYAEIYADVFNIYKKSINQKSFFNHIEEELLHKRKYDRPSDFALQNDEQPQAEVTIEKVDENNPRMYMIVSKGKIGSKERVVRKEIQIKWVNKNLPMIPPAALLTNGRIYFENGIVKGNVYVSNDEEGGIQIGNPGDPTLTETIFYLPPEASNDLINKPPNFSKLPNEGPYEIQPSLEWDNYGSFVSETIAEVKKINIEEKLTINKNETTGKITEDGSFATIPYQQEGHYLKIKQSVHLPKLSITSNQSLIIDTENNNIILYVDNFDVPSGKIIIEGQGELTLIVKDEMKFASDSQIIGEINLIYLGENDLILGDQLTIKDYILVDNISVSAKNLNFNGILISNGNNVSFEGNNNEKVSEIFAFAPHAKVTMQGSYSINGTILAKEFHLKGTSQLTYKNLQMMAPNIDDLLSSGPTLEKSEVSE